MARGTFSGPRPTLRLSDRDPKAAAKRLGRGFARRGIFPFPLLPLLVLGIVVAATGHVPWIAVAVAAVLVLVLAPWRPRRGSGHRGGAC